MRVLERLQHQTAAGRQTLGAKTIGAGSNTSYAVGGTPTITALKPKYGPVVGGTQVLITGTNFTGVSEIDFGTAPATGFTILSPTKILAETPAVTHAGFVEIPMVNDWTTGRALSTFTGGLFRYTPVVTGVSPNSGPAAGGTTVTVTGAGFYEGKKGTKFKFGSTRAASVNCTSTTSCTVTAPAHAAETVDVRALAGLQQSAKNPPFDQFTYK